MADEITRDIAREARREDLDVRTKALSAQERASGRSAGFTQADILARTFAEDSPLRLRSITERESTNVEDRRFTDELIDHNAPMAQVPRMAPQSIEERTMYEARRKFGDVPKGPSLYSSNFRGSDAYSQVVTAAEGAWDSIRTTLDLWSNPKKYLPDDSVPADEADRWRGRMNERALDGAIELGMGAQTGAYSRAAPGLVGRALRGEGILPTTVTELAAGGPSVARETPFQGGTPLQISPQRYKTTTPKGAEVELVPATEGDTMIKINGRVAGDVTAMVDPQSGRPTISNISITKAENRGLGTGDAVYEQAIKTFPDLAPSLTLENGTYRIWEKMNPELLKAGKYVREMQDDGHEVWVRTDHKFSEYKPKTKTDPSSFPDQSVMNFKDAERTVYRQFENAVNAGQDITQAPPAGTMDVSYSPKLSKAVAAKAEVLVQKKADDVLNTLKKELPDLQFEVEKSSRSHYIYIKDGDKLLMKARVSDHAATRFDSISIDPVTGNTLDTLLQALRYERGLVDEAPEIGWSLVPPRGFRGAMNKEAGMDVFPDGRQIGGRATYKKGAAGSQPFDLVNQTIGTDIQWKLPKKAAE